MGELQRAAAVRQTAQPSMRSRDASPRGPRGRRSERELTAVPLHGTPARRALQPALAIGAADDPFEREAERTADAVMASPEGPARTLGGGSIAASLLRFVRRALGKGESPAKKDEDERKRLQKAPAAAGPGQEVVPAAVESGIQRMSAGGEPLSPSLRSFFEPRFGYDFGGVRMHTGGEAAGAAVALGARAFTVDDHVFFGAGEYQPASASGQRLIAHELTHTIQQKPAAARAARLLPAPRQVQRSWFSDATAAALAKIRDLARDMPGYTLLSFILGRDPITEEAVQRTPKAFVKAVLDLVPGGDKIFENLEKSKTIEKTVAWLQEEIRKLDLSWAKIKELFRQAWDAFSLTDLLSPLKLFDKVKAIFLPPVKRVIAFALAVGKKVFEFIFEGIMMITGSTGTQIVGILRKIGSTFMKIIEHPIDFAGNLVQAVKQGFEQFSKNIWEHLKAGIIQWLTGALAGAGLVLPKEWDLKGILSLVLQVLGVTYAKVRVKLVKVIGEERVAMLEDAFDFVKAIVIDGPIAAWQMIVESLGSLWDLVIGGIKDWAITSIVKTAITKLVSMFNPAGAIIQAIIAIYDTIAFFVENMKRIVAVFEAVTDSIANVVAGKVADAANAIELTMARTIPVILGFLARFLKLGDVGGAIKKVITGIREKVDKAIDKVIAWIVEKAKTLLGKKEEKEVKEGGDEKWEAGVAGVISEVDKLSEGGVDGVMIEAAFPAWKVKYGFKSLVLKDLDDGWDIRGEMSPEKDVEPIVIKQITFDIQRTSAGQAEKVHAVPVHRTDYSEPSENPVGWERLNHNFWVRGHLLHGRSGGPGLNWNLVPIPKTVNSAMWSDHEKELFKLVGRKPRPLVWFQADVTYHKDGGAEKVREPWNFAKQIKVRYGSAKLKKDKSFQDLPATGTPEPYSIYLPTKSERDLQPPKY